MTFHRGTKHAFFKFSFISSIIFAWPQFRVSIPLNLFIPSSVSPFSVRQICAELVGVYRSFCIFHTVLIPQWLLHSHDSLWLHHYLKSFLLRFWCCVFGNHCKTEMQGGRGGRGSLFGFDPFADFGGFGGLGRPQSLLSSFFGGRDPFDDPFFTRPFGSPFESVFESSFFRPTASPLTSASPAGFIEQQQPQPNKRRGPIIEEINSDDENAEDGGASRMGDNPRKHSRLDKEPSVQVPPDEADGERNKHIQQRNDFRSRRPQPQCFTFQSSTVSYGGANGAHYTKSMARRAGSDGVTFEEFKEADSTTGQANHRISRGIHNKGHTLSRKLNSDGRVDTMQTLHNLNEEELGGFEQAWEGSAGRHLPGWQQRLEGGNVGLNSHGCPSRGGWALPYTQQTEHLGNNNPQIGGRVDAAHVQQTMERAADHAYMQQTMRSAADHGHMQQTMRRAEDRVHMQQSGRRAPDRGHRGRTRA